MYRCKFRLPQKEGRTCQNICYSESKICAKHQSKMNDASYILLDFEDSDVETPERFFYNLMKHLIRYYHNKEIERIFYFIVDYIYSKSGIRFIILKNNYKLDKTKSDMIRTILLETTAKVIQRWFRKHLYLKIIKYQNITSENDDDPFTFDKIEEIPIHLRYTFKDSNNHFYCFNAVEFHFFVKNFGKWNPYTKNNLTDDVLQYLDLFIFYNNLSNSRKECRWESNTHAYVEVSQALEKAGFYNDVKWFEKISFDTCVNIVKLYQTLFREPYSTAFGSSFSLTPETYVFDFCKEVLLLFSTYEQDYLSCCNFVKVLAFKSEDFYNNIPDWLLQIETPIIDFNYDTGFLIMYIDNLFVNTDQIEYDIEYAE